MKTQISRRFLAALPFAFLTLAACDTTQTAGLSTGNFLQPSLKKDITLIALRHADRDAGNEELNADGRQRAKALPAALRDYPIDAIYAPGFKRNLDTGAPLADARNMSVQNIPADSIAAQLAKEPNHSSVVWIGNKENLKKLWADTGAPGEPPLNYGEVFVVQFYKDKPAWVSQLHFGK